MRAAHHHRARWTKVVNRLEAATAIGENTHKEFIHIEISDADFRGGTAKYGMGQSTSDVFLIRDGG